MKIHFYKDKPMFYCLAPSEWIPGTKLLPAFYYQSSRYWAEEESKLKAIRVFFDPITACWASLCWKQGPVRPWLIEFHPDGLYPYSRSTGTKNVQFKWLDEVPEFSISRVLRYFDWHVCWPNELKNSMELAMNYFSEDDPVDE